jgi:hypothetical protein
MPLGLKWLIIWPSKIEGWFSEVRHSKGPSHLNAFVRNTQVRSVLHYTGRPEFRNKNSLQFSSKEYDMLWRTSQSHQLMNRIISTRAVPCSNNLLHFLPCRLYSKAITEHSLAVPFVTYSWVWCPLKQCDCLKVAHQTQLRYLLRKLKSWFAF